MELTFYEKGLEVSKIKVKKSVTETLKDRKDTHFYLIDGTQKYFFKMINPKEKDLVIGNIFSSYLYERLGLKNDEFVKYKLGSVKNIGKVKQGVVCDCYFEDGDKILDAFNIMFFCACQEYGWDYSKIISDKKIREEYEDKFDELLSLNDGLYAGSVENILECVNKYCKAQKLEFDKQKIELKLKQMIILDYFFAQRDRHLGNIEFKIRNNKLGLCPIFDNEYSFGFAPDDYYKKLFKSPNQRFTMRTGLSEAGAQCKLLKNGRLTKNAGFVVLDILDETKCEPKLKKLVDKCLKLDIKKEVKDFCETEIALKRQDIIAIENEYSLRRNKFFEIMSELEKRTKGKFNTKEIFLNN